MARPTLFVLAALSAALPACSTPKEVREGAKWSSAQVELVKTELQSYGKASSAAARERMASIIELEHVIQEVEARRALRLESMARSGMTNEVSVYNTLIALADKMEELQLTAAAREAALAQRLDAGIAELSLPTWRLARSAEQLAALGEPLTSDARASFLQTYLLGVGREYARLREESERSVAEGSKESAAKSSDVNQQASASGQ
ncbi:MAG TPA: hypothetical protein VFV80_02045 [Geminicoccaceae bacterium]|nr:hypothetical protein [Geminicoccaceae bacterium]